MISHRDCCIKKNKLDDYNQGWNYFLWTNSKQVIENNKTNILHILSIDDLEGINEYSKIFNYYVANGLYSLMSDIVRQQIILQKGGVYCDVDYHFLNSPATLHYIYQAYFGIEREEWSCNVGSGFIAASKDHPIFILTSDLNRAVFGFHTTHDNHLHIDDKWFLSIEKDCIGAALRIAMKHLTISVHIENNSSLILTNNMVHDVAYTPYYYEYIFFNREEMKVYPIGYQDYAQSWQDKCNNELDYQKIIDNNDDVEIS